MKRDVWALANLQLTAKRPSKETLNHPELIYLASGLDPFTQTPIAYRKAYESLGIDIINRMPEKNAPKPLDRGKTAEFGIGYQRAYLGLYDTVFREKFPFQTVEDFWAAKEVELDFYQLITPVPHRLDKSEIERKMALAGEVGLYYYMLYTTLFMWAVEYLGWEVFLLAAGMDPDGFKEKFLDQAFEKSLALITTLAEIDAPFVFCHDDLASAQGPMLSPKWYEKYIFPKYEALWAPIKKAGKKVIFVADGNMSAFLEPLCETGIDGVMFENPATDFDLILQHFGSKIVIGGIDTRLLTFGSPSDIKKHVLAVYEKAKDLPGFVMSTPGGIHGNIPLENLAAYFDTRVELGFTPANWRKAKRGPAG